MTLPVFSFQIGEKIGIFGGGQLGRMLALEAQRLGLQTVVFCQHPREPAALIATEVVLGEWTDQAALHQFATSGIRWLLCEWENVPVEAVEFVGRFVQVHSLPKVLSVGRSRKAEKTMANDLGIGTTKWMVGFRSTGYSAHTRAWDNDPGPFIAKIDNGGYDGGGQTEFADWADRGKHYRIGGPDMIIEQKVDLDFECSITVVRTPDFAYTSPLVRNVHTNKFGGGILQYSYHHEGMIGSNLKMLAKEAARRIADHLDLHGAMTIEFFVTKDGRLLFNELAPRVHNSFHGTIEGANQSQFYWHVAAAVGLHIEPMRFNQPWMMVNLLGEQIDLVPQLVERGWSVHVYGKAAAKTGRKMGHATILVQTGDGVENALAGARELGLVD